MGWIAWSLVAVACWGAWAVLNKLALRSLGWQVCRFWVYELREDMAACVKRVREALTT